MSRGKSTGRQHYKSWYQIPRPVHRSADYRQLTGNAVKLLNALAYQFTGNNNGDLCATWSVMQKQHGFRSPDTLNNVRKELLDANLIHVTRQGHSGRCSLYAVTWLPIDECKGKLESDPTKLPIRKEWNQVKVTASKTKRMTEKQVIDFAERKEEMNR